MQKFYPVQHTFLTELTGMFGSGDSDSIDPNFPTKLTYTLRRRNCEVGVEFALIFRQRVDEA